MLDDVYLIEAAKIRGITKTRLAHIVMQKIIDERLITSVLQDNEKRYIIQRAKHYRRFPDKRKKTNVV